MFVQRRPTLNTGTKLSFGSWVSSDTNHGSQAFSTPYNNPLDVFVVPLHEPRLQQTNHSYRTSRIFPSHENAMKSENSLRIYPEKTSRFPNYPPHAKRSNLHVGAEQRTYENRSSTDKRWLTRFYISFAAAIILLIIGSLVAALVVSQTFKTTTQTTSTTSVTTTSATTTTSTTASTTSTSTTSTTTTTTTSLLPSQCSNYMTINDATRHVSYSATVACDSSAFGNGTWVRFVSPAGTQIPATSIPAYSCGTHATAWYNSAYPSTPGATVTGTVCYNWGGNTCFWSTSIQVTNCISYYVFFLRDPPAFNLRYCTT